MTATDETPELHAELSDVLRMVARLGGIQPMGREGRKILFALAAAAPDVVKMEGLVLDGETYAVTEARWAHAVCHCGNGLHEWRRDAPKSRGHWHDRRADADTALAEAKAHHAAWNPKQPVPHLVRHLVAATATEVVR